MYNGAEFNGVWFSDIPIDPTVEFHFILVLVADYDTSASLASAADGTFNVFWDTQNLGPSIVYEIQSQHSNVKGALSLGGDTKRETSVYFDPLSIHVGLECGYFLHDQYNLDGIDIDYEHFVKGYDNNMFSRYIGQLITILKNDGIKSFAIIALYDTVDVQSNYMTLWRDYGSVIDHVNFQFYANNYCGGQVFREPQ